MSKRTAMGRLKAKHNPAFRDPSFFGGLCCVCKKRQRHWRHEHYPHMCDQCRESRVFSKELPFTDPSVARAILQKDWEIMEKHRKAGTVPDMTTINANASIPKYVQSLNEPTASSQPALTLQQRIAESAARFRATVKK